MSAIGPGDWVEALRPEPAEGGFQSIAAGQVYQVDHMVRLSPPVLACPDCGDCSSDAFTLVGDRLEDEEAGWCACGFRPIYRPKADLIERLTAPSPFSAIGAPVLEPAR